MPAKHILVLGAGSVGKRHLRNFASLGCRVSAMDPRRDRLDEAGKETELAHAFAALDEAWRADDFDAVVIASPPAFHVDQCLQCLQRGKPVLLEKPLSPSLADARRLPASDAGRPASPALLIGYTYRWWPSIVHLRDMLRGGAIGKPLYADFVMSAHLADWHPWEPYQQFFMASEKLGGGALLDESHFIDLLVWLFGMPKSVYATVERISSLEIETDDHVDILASYDWSFRARIHLDLYGRPHEKTIRIVGESGTLVWTFEPDAVRIGLGAGPDWKEIRFGHERNEMFLRLAGHFLDIVRGDAEPACALRDGLNVMEVVEACRQSSRSGRSAELRSVGTDGESYVSE